MLGEDVEQLELSDFAGRIGIIDGTATMENCLPVS